MPVEDLTRFKSEKTPVLIEETYEIETHTPKEEMNDNWDSIAWEGEESHLFILVHGF